MAWQFHVLVVANVTATADELLSAAEGTDRPRALPLHPPHAARRRGRRQAPGRCPADHAGGRAGRGQGRLGDPDPIVAVMEVWDPLEFDEIVVSTLPTGVSRWLGLDLPRRLEKLTSVSVEHVVSQPPADEVQWERRPSARTTACCRRSAAALTRR